MLVRDSLLFIHVITNHTNDTRNMLVLHSTSGLKYIVGRISV